MTENAEKKNKKKLSETTETKPVEAKEKKSAAPAEAAATEPGAEGAEAVEKIEGMEADVKQVGPCKMEVKVRVPAEAIKKELNKTFDELTPNAAIPGFRKGHAPRRLVERHYESAVLDDVKKMLVARSWEQVTKEHSIHPVGDPDLTDDKIQYDAEKGLSYELSLEVAPQFEIKDYKGLDLKQPASAVTDEEVQKTLDGLRKRNAVLEPLSKGTTKEEDVAVVDCDIKVEGKVIQTVSDQEITIGVDNWLRGLDADFWKELVGKKGGESAAKTVTLPKTYQKEEFRGKQAEVEVKVKDIKRPKMPELNDEFAKDMLYESLEDLKKDVRERLSSNKDREVRADLAKQVEEKLLAMVEFALPEELMKSMAESTANRQRMSLAYQGVPREEIEKAAGVITEGAQKKTERDTRLYFILQQVAEKEKIEVTDAEVERRITVMAQMEGQRPAKFREELKSHGRMGLIRSEIRDEKCINRIIELADVKDAEGKAVEKKKSKKAKKAAGETTEAEGKGE